MGAFWTGVLWLGVGLVVSMFGHACYQTWLDTRTKVDGGQVERSARPGGTAVAGGPSRGPLPPPVEWPTDELAPCLLDDTAVAARRVITDITGQT